MTFPVLIVDDDENKLKAIRRELISSGIVDADIITVCDAASARRELAQTKFELLLVDIILPARAGATARADVGLELVSMILEDGELGAPRNIVGITADESTLASYNEQFRALTLQILLVDPARHEWKESLKKIVEFISITISRNEKFDIDVCFLSALKYPEYDAVIKNSSDWSAEQPCFGGPLVRKTKVELGGKSRRIVAAYAPQMGPVTSAITANALISEYRPRVLVMTGICGGIDDKLNLGDLIIAEKSWDWQSGKWTDSGDFEPAPDQCSASQLLIDSALSLSDELIQMHHLYRGVKPTKPPALKAGPMVSGSAVVAQSAMHMMFKRQHRKSLAVDMECYGVYKAAETCGVPKPAVICIKSVSDLANRDKSDDLQEYGSEITANFAFAMLNRYFTANENGR